MKINFSPEGNKYSYYSLRTTISGNFYKYLFIFSFNLLTFPFLYAQPTIGSTPLDGLYSGTTNFGMISNASIVSASNVEGFNISASAQTNSSDFHIRGFNDQGDDNATIDDVSLTAAPICSMAVSITAQTNVTCDGGSNGALTAMVSSGSANYNYNWSNGSTTTNTSSNTNSISGLPAGTYTVTVTDANSCTATASSTITEVSSACDIVKTICNGEIPAAFGSGEDASGGSGDFVYLWQNTVHPDSTWLAAAGDNDLAGYVPSNPLFDTIYFRRATIDQNCGDTAYSNSIRIEVPDSLSFNNTVTNVNCNGSANGAIDLSVSGGVAPHTYTWNTGATTEDLTGLSAGSYTVTVTDANGCTSSSSNTVTEPTVLTASATVDSNISCNGYTNGGATASATGGTAAYTYSWNNGATTSSIQGVAAGTYTVTVTDANGCTSTSNTTVTQPAALIASTVVDSNISCNGTSDGGATASATGGTAAYTYSWSNGATVASINGVSAGTYTVTVTDHNGCTSTSSTTVTEPTVLSASTVVDSNITCNGGWDGGATASATGGTSGYTYAWSNGATTTSINGVSAGTYTVTVTDANGCTSSSNTTITEPAVLAVSTVVDSNITCNGVSDGGASAIATGGTAAYTYSWNNGAMTSSIQGVAAGTYTVTVTDANGCTSTSNTTVTQPAALSVSINEDSGLTCSDGSDAQFTATPSGGTSGYTYSWSNGATISSISSLSAGTYTVTVTDANGCTTTGSKMVTSPGQLNGGQITLDN